MTWWTNEFLSVERDRLLCAGRPADEWTGKHGTPLYVYGRDRLLANFDRLRAALAASIPLETRIAYAMKANAHPGILRTLAGRGAWIDAVSPGEIDAALAAGFPGQQILFTGTSMDASDLKRALAVPGITINVDALEALEILRTVRDVEFPGRRVRVSVRWNPGVGRGFNAGVITAGKTSRDGTPIKFGVEEKKVGAAFERARAYGFEPVGLHQHLGSGWVREDYPFVKTAVDRLVRRAAELERSGFPLEFLDFGGGFGPRYERRQGVFPVEDYIAHIGARIAAAGLGVKAVVLEPGKYIVGDAGVLLTRVVYLKESYGRLFACVDAGTYNSVPRPALYHGAYHEIVNAARVAAGPKKRLTVAGNLCETGDVFGTGRLLPVPKPGDILAVLCAGAYCRSMASTFNLRNIPPEILI
jgi:diaminopimelate decarboxylase